MDESRMIIKPLDDSDYFSSDSFDDSDSDSTHCAETDNNSDSQDLSENVDQTEVNNSRKATNKVKKATTFCSFSPIKTICLHTILSRPFEKKYNFVTFLCTFLFLSIIKGNFFYRFTKSTSILFFLI